MARVSVVTGGGSGIGRQSALTLAESGIAVAILDLAGDAASRTADEIIGQGGTAIGVATDVADESQVLRAIGTVHDELGAPTILVNSVAWLRRTGLLDTELAEWNRTLAVCLTSYFVCMKAVVPYMIDAQWGRVINICSISARIGYGFPAYTAAKGGILSMTRELAGELGGHGICVNSVSPGVTETAINVDTLANDAIRQRTIELTPVRRLGQPRDIAAAVHFLASEEASFVTGTDLVVDGGMSNSIPFDDDLRSFHRKDSAR